MRTVILGYDGFDPAFFEALINAGRLPNLAAYVRGRGYSWFEVASPAQSEVSWTSIATGLNPGSHGIFDFVQRDPETYALYPSLLRSEHKAVGWTFMPPFQAPTLFEEAARLGYPATALWWPAMFPARAQLPINCIPGLGTPDIRGRMGVGTLLTADPSEYGPTNKTPVTELVPCGHRRWHGRVRGPEATSRRGTRQTWLEIKIEVLDDERARLDLGGRVLDLRVGEWSPICDVTFRLGPLVRVHAITRVIVTSASPTGYVMPLQVHPLKSPWPYGMPRGFVKDLWNESGPFLTLGIPQDTIALEDGCISTDQFLHLCESIHADRRRAFLGRLNAFHDGVLACVFDTLDRVQHMFWHDRPDVVALWYEKLDDLVSKVAQALGAKQESARIVIVSDHGFASYDYKLHLNAFLEERGHLVRRTADVPRDLDHADWNRTRAYAVGLNSVYINLAEREGQGSVAAGDYAATVDRLRQDLLSWRSPSGAQVVVDAMTQAEAFEGPLSDGGPDLVVGYAPGYRASPETGLGKWCDSSVVTNRDRWHADHCIDSRSVPGVLFCSDGLGNWPQPSYRDVPAITIGCEPRGGAGRRVSARGGHDDRAARERIESLGYF